jgi:hypothetical protein
MCESPAGKPAQRGEQEPGDSRDGASMASAGGDGSQMEEGAKRRGVTGPRVQVRSQSFPDSRARNVREGGCCVLSVTAQCRGAR